MCSEEWETVKINLPPTLYPEMKVHPPTQPTKHLHQAEVLDVIRVRYACYIILWADVFPKHLLKQPYILRACIPVGYPSTPG